MSITFQYPYTAPTLTLTLRNPELGNNEQVDVKTMFKVAMDGSIHSHRQTPMNQRLLLSFTALSKTDIENYFAFITASSGEAVKYTDHEAVVWKGLLVVNPAEVAPTARNECSELYDLTLEFQCVP